MYCISENEIFGEKAHWTTKLNAYKGYVVPIVTYASQVWMSKQSKSGTTLKLPEKSNKLDLVNECRLQKSSVFSYPCVIF